ncbi:MAG: NAD(P)/FAD-dependent oxidoreductase [Solirubrobacterales bacterium]
MDEPGAHRPADVLIIGGGIAGLEALLALRDLAPERVTLTLVAPDPDFIYKPLLVEEPFSHKPAEQRALGPIAEEFGAQFIQQGVATIRPAERVVELDDGSTVRYGDAVVCVGASSVPALARATTLWAPGGQLAIDELLTHAASHESRRIAFVVPSGATWPLPLYEIALMGSRRAVELGLRELECVIVTPEEAPLAIFGPVASDSVAALLSARGIRLRTGARAAEGDSGSLVLTPGHERLEIADCVALPVMEGPRLTGLPADENGFVPIDEHARVQGVDHVYAAGDGTNFPIKQGGLATQQADAAAEHIAARFGASVDPRPFRPVLRVKLLTGDESLNLRSNVAGGAGEGIATSDFLWWPPNKVGGRYLAPWLAGEQGQLDPEPPLRPLDVEVALPKEWHREPMTMDHLRPPDVE